MKKIDLNGQWPILIIVLLFLLIPFSTIPGLFDIVFVLAMGVALVIAVLLIATLVSALRDRRAQR
jgi:ABC-type nickel/cobalt efflux system permease component RcnA